MANLEPVLTDDTTRRNFSKLENLYTRLAALETSVTALVALGLTKRTRGTQNVSTVAALSGTATVTHGLGSTPTTVLVAANDSATVLNTGVQSVGATQFTVGVYFVDGVARTGTFSVGWEAIA